MKIAYIEKNLGQKKLALIAIANAIIADYERQGYDLTLRQLYYQMVAAGHIPNNERTYKNLGTAIDDGRMVGLIDWERIVDRTRNLEGLGHFGSPADIMRAAVYSYHEDKWAGQEYHPEVWVEKQALAGVVQRICNRLDVSFFACRGYVSQSEMWGAARRLMRHRDAGQHPVILYLGDHDPSGIDMTRDVAARLSLFVGDEVEVRRLALNWSQIEEYNPPPNPAKLSDSRSTAYIEAHGDESWELDALPPQTINSLIEDELNDLIDFDAFEAAAAAEAKNKALLQEASKRWPSVARFLEK